MKTILKSLTPVIVIVLLTIVDIPLLPVELVPEAHAIFGVRRRTAVVAYSAGAASASANAKASSSQQQAAPAPAPQPAAAPAQPVSAIPVGTIEEKLPAECVAVTVGNVKYQECSGVFYRTAFQGNNLVYVVVGKPL
jgi:hypothetical protein